MTASAPEKTNVFQFMVIRPPNSLDTKASLRDYIADDDDLFSDASSSAIGQLIYRKVFCDDPPKHARAIVAVPTAAGIIDALLETLPLFEPTCPRPTPPGALESLRDRTSIVRYGRFYLLPDRIEYLQGPILAALPAVLDVLHAPPMNGDALNRAELLKVLGMLLDSPSFNEAVAVGPGKGYTSGFVAAKRTLFDTLYLLYILRRVASINLEHIIDGLRALHALEALAGDPPVILDLDDLTPYLAATPIIHPLFAKLHRFRVPFNTVRPLGIGDLKVVKQWLCGYKAGDFAHVENVLDGETKVRIHRRLERTEEVFSSSSETQEESQRDTQSTDRFELKREAENIIKQDLAANANANVTYNGGTVVATVTAGMSYTRSQTDQNKTADNFSREVIDKAVKRIQSKASQQRSTTMLFETEETNTHTLANTPGKGHISGIYRWLDKEYRAQLYNYGKRMMFEFILPEPAAFFVEARMRAYEEQIDIPKPPQEVSREVATLDFRADQIDPVLFDRLQLDHDLADLSFPVQNRTVPFKDSTTGQAFVTWDNPTSKSWKSKSFSCDLRSKGYDVVGLTVEGTIDFSGQGAAGPGNQALRNLFSIAIDGTPAFFADYGSSQFHSFHIPNVIQPDDALGRVKYSLATDVVELVLGAQNVVHTNLQVSARLTLSKQALHDWQQTVYARVFKAKQQRLDDLYDSAAKAYQVQLALYHNRLTDLRTIAINDLLQGQSDAFNRQLIVKELKRLCLAMITKDFDASNDDDVTTKIEAMGERKVSFTYRQLQVTEKPNATLPTSVDVQFAKLEKAVAYPAPELSASTIKARYIQFLEQAFDWQQLAYEFYPYFWATPPKWIDLMSRQDQADAALSAFLQAGACRVLLACMPAYDHAVLHYLATGEPWEGGLAPVIGDPLYVPLYEELHRQQDDLDGATADGPSWRFTVPTSLVYLENSTTPLPPSLCEPVTP